MFFQMIGYRSRSLVAVEWACSSVRLERTPDKREVDGSIPSRPTRRAKLARVKAQGRRPLEPFSFPLEA